MTAFDLFGPGFTTLYGCLVAAATMAALALRMGLERADGEDAPDAFAPTLHPIEVAYLAGGATAAMDLAVASVRRRALVHDDKPERRVETLHGVLVNDVLPVERAVYAIVAKHGGTAGRGARREVEPVLAPVRLRLAWLKLVAPERSARRTRRLQLLLFAALLALGAWQVVTVQMSAARDTPSSYAVLILGGAAAWLLTYVRPTAPYRSRRGQRLLDELRAKHIALLWKLREDPHRLPTQDYILAVALFGERERVEGTAYAAIVRMATPRSRPGVGADANAGGGVADAILD